MSVIKKVEVEGINKLLLGNCINRLSKPEFHHAIRAANHLHLGQKGRAESVIPLLPRYGCFVLWFTHGRKCKSEHMGNVLNFG